MTNDFDQNEYMDWAVSQCPWIDQPKDPLQILIDEEEDEL